MPPPSHDRALEIDGIRGWASFCVLLYHTFHEMLTRLVPWINSVWIAPFFEGRLAVCIFFVLSGDALSVNYLARGASDPSSVDRLVVRRYTRLTIPIVMSCALVYLVRLLHADWHAQATVIIDRPDWLGELIAFQFSPVGFLRYVLLGVYTNHTKATSYNPFLWTMSVEILGSMLVFLSCYLWPRLTRPKAVVAAVAFALFALNSFLCLFFFGMWLGALRREGLFTRLMATRARRVGMLAAFAALMLLLVAANRHRMPLFFDLGTAVAIVFVLYGQPTLRGFLRGRLSTWLGDISFPIYLVQFAVIISLESWLVTVWNVRQLGVSWLPYIAVTTVCATVVAACLFRQAEKFALSRADRIVLRILRRDR